jgi:ketosteroid isomerase-like protein
MGGSANPMEMGWYSWKPWRWQPACRSEILRAMSQENIEVIRDQYAATNERDFDRVMSYYDEDVELVFHVPDIRAGTFKGRDATGRWFGDWFRSFDRDARFDVKELTQLEDGSVLVVADHHARGRASGAEVHGTVVWLYRLRNRKIIRVDGYQTRDEALEAAGLRN